MYTLLYHTLINNWQYFVKSGLGSLRKVADTAIIPSFNELLGIIISLLVMLAEFQLRILSSGKLWYKTRPLDKKTVSPIKYPQLVLWSRSNLDRLRLRITNFIKHKLS